MTVEKQKLCCGLFRGKKTLFMSSLDFSTAEFMGEGGTLDDRKVII